MTEIILRAVGIAAAFFIVAAVYACCAISGSRKG